MDRLLRLALFLLSLVVVGGALAQAVPSDGYPVVPVPQYSYGGIGPGAAQDVCDQVAQYAGSTSGPNLNPYGVLDPGGGTSMYCDIHQEINANNGPCGATPCGDHVFLSLALTYVGPANSCPDANSASASYSGGTYCKCNSGYTSTGSACKSGSPPPPKTCPPVGTSVPSGGASYTWSGIASGGAGCVGGCAVWSGATDAPAGGGTPFSYGDFISAGSTCDGSGNAGAAPSTPKTPDQASCAAGTCPGTVNGVTVCVACGTPSTTTVTSGSTTTTNPDGSTTTTPGNTTVTNTQDNGNGTQTTTTTTTAPGGGTTTTTSTGPSTGIGKSSGAGTGTGTGSGNCTGSNCGDGTDSFGGSCAAAFTCDGDAIQCAIAQEQHQRDCTFYQPESSGGTVQDEATRFSTAKSDGIAPSWSPAASGNASNVSMDFNSAIDQTRTWDSTCPADQHFSFLGVDVAMPLSGLCVSLTILGNFILAVTSLACAGIVFKK